MPNFPPQPRPRRQHHDAGAGLGNDAILAARVSVGVALANARHRPTPATAAPALAAAKSSRQPKPPRRRHLACTGGAGAASRPRRACRRRRRTIDRFQKPSLIANLAIMPLHLIKLAVGCDSVKELKSWVAERMQTAKQKGLPRHHIHITRMTPKRDEELLAGGSLYWVIRGEIAAREKIIAIEPFRDRDGIGRCRLVMQPKVIAVLPRPMRAFQGWRYFAQSDVPPDLGVRGRRRRGDARAVAPRIARSRAALSHRACRLARSKPRYCRSAVSFRFWPPPESASVRPSPRRSAPASRRGGPRNNPA